LAAAITRKLVTLLVAGLLLGWAYVWAAPRLYLPETVASFWRGTAHGALMPAALPSLLMGNDVPIFAPNNDGRIYKIGYIAGINLCGLVFFGLAFRKTASKSRAPAESQEQGASQ
jgi:cytosine/uracil/thiamine/allantoin permease